MHFYKHNPNLFHMWFEIQDQISKRFSSSGTQHKINIKYCLDIVWKLSSQYTHLARTHSLCNNIYYSHATPDIILYWI